MTVYSFYVFDRHGLSDVHASLMEVIAIDLTFFQRNASTTNNGSPPAPSHQRPQRTPPPPMVMRLTAVPPRQPPSGHQTVSVHKMMPS